MQKKCVVCDESFFQKYQMQSHCSNACLKILKQQQKNEAKRNKPISRPKKQVQFKKKPEKKPITKMVIKGRLHSFIVRESSKSENIYKYNCKKIRDLQMINKGYRYCERCMTGGNHRTYQTHHIIYRSEREYHKDLHDIRNLIRLCSDCHAWFHEVKNRRHYLIIERDLEQLFGPLI